MKLIKNKNSKVCSKCNKLKPFSDFYKQETGKYGYRADCKKCTISKNQKYFKEKPELRKKYYQKNKQKLSNYHKRRYLLNNSIQRNYEDFRNILNQSRFCTKCKEYKSFDNYYSHSNGKYGICPSCKKCNIKSVSEYTRNNDEYKLRQRLSSRLCLSLKNNNKNKKLQKLLGISYSSFKNYLERQFEKGMTWDNYGEWEIDHIVPCSMFDHSKEHEIEECWFYTNLQPLWKSENRQKYNKY